MGASLIVAGLSFWQGNKAKNEQKRAQLDQFTKNAWSSYGENIQSFELSREQAEQYYVTDKASAVAKAGASGMAPGSDQWVSQVGTQDSIYQGVLDAITERENAWMETTEYQFALANYEEQTSISEISRNYGYIGDVTVYDPQDSTSYVVGHDNIIVGGDNPNAIGSPINSDLMSGYTFDRYIQEEVYNAVRPTMEEYYWLYYGTDETRKAEIEATIKQRFEYYSSVFRGA